MRVLGIWLLKRRERLGRAFESDGEGGRWARF